MSNDKLREALIAARPYVEDDGSSWARQVVKQIDAALAEPASEPALADEQIDDAYKRAMNQSLRPQDRGSV